MSTMSTNGKTARTPIPKSAQRIVTPDQIESALGKAANTAFKALQAANKVAGEARENLSKAVHVAMFGEKGLPPQGKKLVMTTNYGKLWLAITDGDAPKTEKDNLSLADWLKTNAAA